MIGNFELFRAEMARHELEYVGQIYADGKIHRIKCAGDKARDSWYVLHAGPPRAGAYGSWRLGVKETWCEKQPKEMTETQWAAVRKHWEVVDTQRKREERERQETAQAIAARLYDRAKPAEPKHPYLLAKGVQPHGDLRQTRDGVLLLPLRDSESELHSVQLIAADGTKRFLSGGRVRGCFFSITDKSDGPQVLCEGYATGASIHEATGYAVVCALSCGNLVAVAQSMRERWPDRELIIAADNDAWPNANGKSKPNAGLDAANKAALAVRARVAVPAFAGLDTSSRPTDFNDLAGLAGLPAVAAQLVVTETPQETDEQIFSRLAELSTAQYDRVREAEAARLHIRVGTLDDEVKRLRKWRGGSDRTLQGHEVDLREPEPWPEPVGGAAVLDAASATVTRYVALPPGAADAIALWDAGAHCFECFEHFPRLAITSPEKGCGKTTLRDVLAVLVPRPLPAESLTPAVLFRLVEARKPTLLADEYDAWIGEADELRGMLNAGHKRGGQALRCEGDNHDVRGFNVFGPVVLCGIGALPPTLHDRSILVRLTRAKRGEIAARFDSRKTVAETEICRKLARWTADHAEQLAACDPSLPEGAYNRIGDNWRPLFAIAEVAGGDWPSRAAAAFAALTASEDLDAQGVGTLLLTDIAELFRSAGVDRLPSATIAEALGTMEGRPWPEFGKAHKPITCNGLARLLRKFGVTPDSVRVGDETPKGYHLAQFTDAFERFLPNNPFSKRNNATTPAITNENTISKPQRSQDVLHPANGRNSNNYRLCCGVAVQNPAPAEDREADLL